MEKEQVIQLGKMCANIERLESQLKKITEAMANEGNSFAIYIVNEKNPGGSIRLDEDLILQIPFIDSINLYINRVEQKIEQLKKELQNA